MRSVGQLVKAAQSRIGSELLLGLIMSAALVLRLLYLGRKSLWLDETASVEMARMDWPSFVHELAHAELHHGANMTLYHLLLRRWVLLGDSEWLLRSLSVIFSLATLPVLYALGTRLFGRRVGLVSALLLAVNAFHVKYAQEARSYSLLVLLLTVASWLFVESIEKSRVQHWVGYVLTSVLALYSHFFAAFVVLAHWVSLLFVRDRKVPWTALAASTLAIGLLVLPLALYILRVGSDPLEWVQPPGAGAMRGVLFAFAGGSDGAGWLFLVACLGGVVAHRTWLSGAARAESWYLGFVVAWLLVPLLTVLALSRIQPMFVDRYLIICLPAFILLAALGLSSISNPRVFAVALAVMMVVSTFRVFHYYEKSSREDWRDATQYILTHAEAGDALVFFRPHVRRCYEYYRERLIDAPRVTIDVPIAEESPSAVAFDQLKSRYRRVWVVLSHAPSDTIRRLRELAQARYAVVEERQFLGVEVLQYRADD